MPPHSLNSHMTRPSWASAQRTKIAIIGAGELGLRTAVEFADRGYQVVCASVVGESPGESAANDDGVRRHTRAGRLRLTNSSADAARHGQVVIMAFGPQPDGALPDDVEYASLASTAAEVAQNLAGPTVIVDKTTVSETTADRIARLMARHSEHEIVVISQAAEEQPAVRVFLRSAQAAASFLHRLV